MNNWRQFLGLALLIGVAVGGLNFHWQSFSWNTPTAPRQATASQAAVPDILAQQPLLETFDEHGRLDRHLQGSQLQHYDNRDETLISEPQLLVNRRNQGNTAQRSPWQLRADTATLRESRNEVDLNGNVLLWNEGKGSDGRMEIRSESLRVDTAREYATTDKAVTIRARRSELHARGLKADLANERLLLTSRVQETHEVKQHP